MKRSTQWSHGALALSMIGIAMVAMGCGGRQHAESTSSVGGGQDAVAASAALPAPPIAAIAGSSAAEQISTVTNDSVPPDVSASIADSLVTPGTVIEVLAKSSPDVEEVLLADGIGKPQRFAYDQTSDSWRASYRVPVKFPGERLGLAVTAKNNTQRWRRVWVFLEMERETVKDTPLVEEK